MSENPRRRGANCTAIHEADVASVESQLLPDDDYVGVASLLRHFGDPTRVKLLHALEARALCVSDLAVILDITKSAVSHHLNALKLSKLVRARREGQVVYYSLDDDHVATILKTGFEHMRE